MYEDDVYAETDFEPLVRERLPFIEGDHVYNAELVKKIYDNVKEYKYIFISLGNDSLNKEIAMAYRELVTGNYIIYFHD